MPGEITSRKNEVVRDMVRLSNSAAYRKERRRFVAEGARICCDAAKSGAPICLLLYTRQAEEKYAPYLAPVREAAGEQYLISPEVASLLAGTKSTQGVFCVCGLPEAPRDFPKTAEGGHCLVLENIQDPANLGAMLRTAEALGIRSVLLGGGCCDAYSPKVLRASMGAVFRLPLFPSPDAPLALKRLREAGFLTLAAVPDASAVPVTSLRFDKPAAVAVGNEGSGLTEEAQRACAERVTIPMRGRAESLNAAASAAILMWELVRAETGGDSE